MTRQLVIILIIGCLMLSIQSAEATSTKKPAPPKQLNAAWKNYLDNDSTRVPSLVFPHAECFHQSAIRYDLPVTLLLAVARGESNFNARAVSSANAIGLMQILWPGTAQHLGIRRQSELFKPCVNVDAGTRYLKELLTRYNGDLHRALAAYNYGPARVSVNNMAMPTGAEWYSGYIYEHLKYVIGRDTKNSKGKSANLEYRERMLPLISFSTSYRASAFIYSLSRVVQSVRLNWIQKGSRRFCVVLLYKSDQEFAQSKQLLNEAGFTPPTQDRKIPNCSSGLRAMCKS